MVALMLHSVLDGQETNLELVSIFELYFVDTHHMGEPMPHLIYAEAGGYYLPASTPTVIYPNRISPMTLRVIQ